LSFDVGALADLFDRWWRLTAALAPRRPGDFFPIIRSQDDFRVSSREWKRFFGGRYANAFSDARSLHWRELLPPFGRRAALGHQHDGPRSACVADRRG